MNEDQIITPWEVTTTSKKGVNYAKVIDQFGCTPMTAETTQQLPNLHHFFKQNIIFAHRDFDKIINSEFYLYTGRGPSTEAMHLGHAIPFMLCKYLQDVFNCHLVIQISDDEKFLWKEMEIEESIKYGKENTKDIIAFGFDPQRTFIFSNVEQAHIFYKNTLRIAKSINLNEARKVFGFSNETSIGQIEFPAKEIAPCFSTSFPFLGDINCLVPCAIDQDPYFRLARDKANQVNGKKPSTIYAKFLPGLRGFNSKMSASEPNNTIFLTDDAAAIKNKIVKYAYSGGGETLEEHRRKGGDTEVDVSFEYLRFFLEDEEELMKIKTEYESGKMLTKDLKLRCVEVVSKFISDYQMRREKITDEDVEIFADLNKFKYKNN